MKKLEYNVKMALKVANEVDQLECLIKSQERLLDKLKEEKETLLEVLEAYIKD